MDDDNPHEIIKLIGKPKKWREKASIILIRLWENDDRIKIQQKGIIALLVGVIGLLVSLLTKLIFLS